MSGDTSAFTGKVPSYKDRYKVGFRVIEIPLGMVRNMDKENLIKEGSGARRLLDSLILEDDLVAISVDEFSGGLTPCKNPDGTYRRLVQHTNCCPVRRGLHLHDQHPAGKIGAGVHCGLRSHDRCHGRQGLLCQELER